MTIKCSCVLAGHGRPITSESSVTPLFIQQPYARDSAFAIVYGCFSRIKKMLGRTEMRTRDRMYCQTIRSVWDISRGDRARIATCSLRTSDRQTYRLKANYSIEDTLFNIVGHRIDGNYECWKYMGQKRRGTVLPQVGGRLSHTLGWDGFFMLFK